MPRPSQCPVCWMFELCLSPGQPGCAEDRERGPLEPADEQGNPAR